jgi:DNA sulfur modification protein DndB
MSKLRLPSIKGQFGDWVYFIATMKVRDVADPIRIATVSESRLYSTNINEVLQREIDSKRIDKIAQYLQSQKERFLNTIIVAISQGNPTWSEIRIQETFKINKEQLSNDEVFFLDGRLGILTLDGSEHIFVLDGQHRIKGIRSAVKSNKEFGNEDITLIFVVHNEDLQERTRRLFTVLNRYAEKPKKAELIIMDEDDAAAILTRRLVMNYETFLFDNALSKSRDLNMPASDFKSFTTLTCVYEINKYLIDFGKLYPKNKILSRLSEEHLEELYNENIIPFWDYFFSTFTEVVKFIAGDTVSKDFRRNKINGGSLLLRPEGQLLIAEFYKYFYDKGPSAFKKFKLDLPKIDLHLSSDTWKYIFWTGSKVISKNKKLKKDILLHLLGEKINSKELNENIKAIYKEYNEEYKGQITALS